MINNPLWSIFKNSGSVDAYLAYKNADGDLYNPYNAVSSEKHMRDELYYNYDSYIKDNELY